MAVDNIVFGLVSKYFQCQFVKCLRVGDIEYFMLDVSAVQSIFEFMKAKLAEK